ncbi:MAG: hypothetical protein AAF587_34340 [Bacteroidota bacterium]
MKYIISLFLFLIITSGLLAQVPQAFSYQAVARDADGVCIQNSSISIRISIRDTAANGPILYQEQHFGVQTNSQGLFSLLIGADPSKATGGGETTDFSSLSWANQSRWMEVEMDTSDGGAFLPVGSQQLLSVPYSLAADNGKQLSQANGNEYLILHGKNGQENVNIGGRTDANGDYNYGRVYVMDNAGITKGQFQTNNSYNGAGELILRGANGEISAQIYSTAPTGTTDSNYGYLKLFNESNSSRVRMYVSNTEKHGVLQLLGPNSNSNVVLSNWSGNDNHGYMDVRDANGSWQARMYVDGSGNGIIQKDVSNFIMDHPHDPTKDIVYACIEGPEAAAYERGTATLIKGEAHISFSEHFEIVANHESMTVILTPRSPDSKGLAAFEYTETGFKVKELFQGKGNYDFDWEAKAVRKGFEDYEVIRDKIEDPSLEMEEER